MSIILHLKAKHFQNTVFESICECPVAKAAKEQFHAHDVTVSTTYIYLNNETFYRIHYDYAQFNADIIIAKFKKYSDDIVAEIRLIEPQLCE